MRRHARPARGVNAQYKISPPEIKGRALTIVIPSGAFIQQRQALSALESYGRINAVDVRIVEMER